MPSPCHRILRTIPADNSGHHRIRRWHTSTASGGSLASTLVAAAAVVCVLATSAPRAAVAQSSHHDSDPFPGVHTRVVGERPAFGAQTCGGGDPGMPAHELWGDVIVAESAHKTMTSTACCEACENSEGCNVW